MFQQILALINTYFLVFLNAIFINIFPTFKLMKRNVVEKDSWNSLYKYGQKNPTKTKHIKKKKNIQTKKIKSFWDTIRKYDIFSVISVISSNIFEDIVSRQISVFLKFSYRVDHWIGFRPWELAYIIYSIRMFFH